MLIGGEAGVGKTTLAEALCREAELRGVNVFAGHCYDLSETPPYGPWIEIAQQIRTAPRPPSPETIAAMPRLASAVSQASLFAQVRDFLSRMTAESPLLLLLEDCQWADIASLDLLRALARVANGLSLLLVATYRGEELDRRHPLHTMLPLLVREARAERLEVRPFDRTGVEALIATRYRLSRPDAARLGTYLLARTEGNPLFLTELLRTLEHGGLLRTGEEGSWEIGAIEQAPVPILLRQVFDARLARFVDEDVALLAVAAVIGQEVPLALWQRVVGTDEERLTALIEQATEAHLTEAWADGDGMRFRHALIRDALYEGMPAPRRRRLHRQVGATLIDTPAADPDMVAYHLQRGGDDRAVAWLVAAGERAQRAFAFPTAVERYEAALAADERLLTPTERGWLCYRTARLLRPTSSARALDHVRAAQQIAAALGDRALAAASLFTEGQTHIVSALSADGLDAMARAVTLFDDLTAAESAQIERQGMTSSIRVMRGTYAMHLAMTGRVAEALATVERTRQRDEVVRRAAGAGGSAVPIVHALMGNPAEARERFAATAARAEATGNAVNVGLRHDYTLLLVLLPYETDRRDERLRTVAAAETAWKQPVGTMWSGGHESTRVFIDLLEGNWQGAEERLQRIIAFPDWHYLTALAAYGDLLRARGAPREAWEQVRRALPDGSATPPGMATYFGAIPILVLAATLALDGGDTQTARTWLETCDRWSDWAGPQVVWGRSEGLRAWAAYHRACGDGGNARRCAEEALQHASAPRQPLALIAAHRLLGEFETADGRSDVARMHLNHALDLVDACHARYEQALTLLSLAELEMSTGRKREAERALAEARTILVPLGAHPALARADTIRARRIAPDARPRYPAGLTAREVEVLRLVAAGLTNAEIAERLFLSRGTVKIHLVHIYNKIGASNRAAAIRFAADHHLE